MRPPKDMPRTQEGAAYSLQRVIDTVQAYSPLDVHDARKVTGKRLLDSKMAISGCLLELQQRRQENEALREALELIAASPEQGHDAYAAAVLDKWPRVLELRVHCWRCARHSGKQCPCGRHVPRSYKGAR